MADDPVASARSDLIESMIVLGRAVSIDPTVSKEFAETIVALIEWMIELKTGSSGYNRRGRGGGGS